MDGNAIQLALMIAPPNTIWFAVSERNQESKMQRHEKRALITDLDNTLWDWFGIWYAGFAPFLSNISKISGLSEDQLKPLIRPIHQKHGTSEYAFVLQSIDEIRRGRSSLEVRNQYKAAIDAYRLGQQPAMKLYPQVAETLLQIKGAGALLVAYTDSKAFYTIRRIRKLGLDGVFDVLFSPVDHEIPDDIDLGEFRMYGDEHYKLTKTTHFFTPRGEQKPNPDILKSIINAIGILPKDCVYVGDSLHRDVKMAQDAGVLDVFAEYGRVQHMSEYKLLQDVSHWTQKEVDHEKGLKKEHVTPTFSLKDGFGDILKYVEFKSGK